MVSEAILTKDTPLADVMFGIDNTFLQRGSTPNCSRCTSRATSMVCSPSCASTTSTVTPIDFGDVCVNYWIDALPDGADAPTTLEDLTDPIYADQLVVMSPESSSPGLAFLLPPSTAPTTGSSTGPISSPMVSVSPPGGPTPITASSPPVVATDRSSSRMRRARPPRSSLPTRPSTPHRPACCSILLPSD